MNKYDKEVMQAQLDSEKAVLRKLEQNYADALTEIDDRIAILLGRADADLTHVIYQVQYQQALKTQVQAILEKLQANEFETVSEYLAASYEEGHISTLYTLQAQGVPLMLPINQEEVVAAIQHETALKESLYKEMGKDIKTLQTQIAGEISRGISNAATYSEIARNISNYSRIPMNRAMTITRTEAGRITETAAFNVQKKAKARGADIVKIWDASLDAKTRDSHVKVDGEIRELDEKFSNGLMHPKVSGAPAREVINCRCRSRCDARWALDADETKMLGDTSQMSEKQLQEIADKLHISVDELKTYSGQIIPVKAKNYADFKKQYNQLWRYEGSDVQKRAEARIAGYKKGGNKSRVRSGAQKMNDDIVQKLKDKGVFIDIEEAGQYREEALENLAHLNKLMDEYKSTTVSYLVKRTLAGTEAGSAYTMNGRTSITVKASGFKKTKATDSLHLGDKQHLGVSYHEFAHSLSQSREKIDKDFWREIRRIKKEYEGNRGNSNWFDVKISDYASKEADEFLAEAFTQAKLSDNPSIYANKVLAVVDKYFKKTSLEKTVKSSTIKSNLQFFAENLSKQSSQSLSKGIKSLNKKIKEHEAKVANPQKYMRNWDNACDQEKAGTVEAWKKEINRYKKQVNARIKELKERGDYNE